MTFETYIATIRHKTGKDPRYFFDEAVRSGVLHPETKTMQFVAWLKCTSGLGHGHAMAVWEPFAAMAGCRSRMQVARAAVPSARSARHDGKVAVDRRLGSRGCDRMA